MSLSFLLFRPASLVALLMLVLACQNEDVTSSEPRTDDSAFWALELSDHAVTLSTIAPYDTVRVAAVARTHDGSAITGLPAPQYRSTNTEKVEISADGLVVGVAPTDIPVKIIAELTADNLRHADTMWVKVVDEPAPSVLTSFSIQLLPTDSAKLPAGGGGSTLAFPYDLQRLVQATDANGAPITDVLTWFRSTNPTVGRAILNYESRLIELHGFQRGTTTVYAQTNLFGVAKTDSLRFEVTWPLWVFVHINTPTKGLTPRFDNGAVRLAPGGIIVWQSYDTAAVEVAFTDPTQVAAGNTSTGFGSILCFVMQSSGGSDCALGGNFVSPSYNTQTQAASWVGRVFPVPGTFEYHSVSDGASARVIVE